MLMTVLSAMTRRALSVKGAALVLLLSWPAPRILAADIGPATEPPPVVDAATAWREAETAIRKFKLARGFKAELIAAEPQLKNAVAFCFDELGNIYVSETGRYRSSTFDIRHHMPWYDDDLACRTVDDRAAMIRKRLGADWTKLQLETETIRFLSDTNHDGRMDVSKIFAAGFTNILDGIASGVLARRGQVWFANIPDLVKLWDSNKDGVADRRKVLHHGFGVHFSLTGHDLHGLTWGPDGRIYFTIGDRGTHLKNQEGRIIDLPDEGACFRMNPDGSDLEVFARGLRNPQELAFDDEGNLFTGENDCDHGDRERWVHILEGSDSGWRIGYQFSEQNPGGAWMSERLWYTNFPGRAAYCTPPLLHIENGPSGICAYPGTGLGDAYKGTFFITHFKGVDNLSGIRSLKMRPKGASFEVSEEHEIVWNTLPTDVEFSPDGYLHFSDWVHGWPKSERSRIYRLVPETLDPRATETARILAEGFSKRGNAELAGLLQHPDRRVRQESQFELADRSGWVALLGVALDTKAGIGRLHALWGIDQIIRRYPMGAMGADVQKLLPLLTDAEPRIQGAVARILGRAAVLESIPSLTKLFAHPSEMVRYQALMSWDEFLRGLLGRKTTADILRRTPETTDGERTLELSKSLYRAATRKDLGQITWPGNALRTLVSGLHPDETTLRHAASLVLADLIRLESPKAIHSPAPDWLADWQNSTSRPVRMTALLALRHLKSPAIASFLKDPDLLLVTEAARAINDAPIPDAFPSLAALLTPTWKPTPDQCSVRFPSNEDFHMLLERPLTRRVINAAFRQGSPNSVKALLAFAQEGKPEMAEYRAEALRLAGQWEKPSARDTVTGLYRPLSNREAQSAFDALSPRLITLLKDSSPAVVVAAAQAASQLHLKSAAPMLSAIVLGNTLPASAKIDCLRAFATLRSFATNDASIQRDWESALKGAANATDMSLRKEATRLSAVGNAAAAAPELAKILQTGSIPEKQAALAALATIPGTVADEIIYGQLRPWVEGQPTPAELQLDILEASESRKDERIQQYLTTYQQSLSKTNPLAPYLTALKGGSVEAGRKVFIERTEAACVRCHRIAGQGGDVGPDLSGIGSKYPREYLLASIVTPNASIAAGFESVLVVRKDGQAVTGVLKKETATELQIFSLEDGLVTVPVKEIQSRQKSASGMPEGIAQLISRGDLRDLIEFLSSLK